MLPVIIEYAGPATTAGRIRHERCKVSKIGAFAFYKSAVKTVVLPDSIKEIGGGVPSLVATSNHWCCRREYL